MPPRKAIQACQIFVRLKSMEELSVITLTFEIYKKVATITTTVDKKYRFSIGESATTSCASILQELILAKHAPKTYKATYLINAEAFAEITALKLRALLELKLVNETNLLKIQAKLTEARRQMVAGTKAYLSSFLATSPQQRH